MSEKRVRDLLQPIDDFPWVPPEATLAEAVSALGRSGETRGPGLVLVVREDGAAREIIGTISLDEVLTGMVPPQKSTDDLPIFWEGQFQEQARNLLASQAARVMTAPQQALSLTSTLMEALHLMNSTGVNLLFVMRGAAVEGLLLKERLYPEIIRQAGRMGV
jgi:CBS domain containing-hemolysin-like protein